MFLHVLVVCSCLVLRRLRVVSAPFRGDVLSSSWSIMIYESTINTMRPKGLTDTTVAANKSARDETQGDQLNRRLQQTCFMASGEAASGHAVQNRDALGPAVLRARLRGPCAPCILMPARPP